MDEELTTEELMDLRVILIRFMADKEAHKEIPRLESRAPKLRDKVDRMSKFRQNKVSTNPSAPILLLLQTCCLKTGSKILIMWYLLFLYHIVNQYWKKINQEYTSIFSIH
jgi:hypothetical protein